MHRTVYDYKPDYSVPPGWFIEEILETRGWKQADLARRCGYAPKTIGEIVNGKTRINPETAILFERVLGVAAPVWMNLDTNYRLRKAQSAEKKELKEAVQWTKKFPVQELIKRGQIDRPADSVETVERLLDFFGFGNIEAWEKYYGNRLIHYRHSHSFNSHFEDIVTWLRIGQITANHESTPLFNMKCFRESLIEIRRLTVEKTSVFQARMKEICHQAGVCLVFVPPIGRIRLSGAAHWLTPHRPIIQMSLRYKTNDHFWFTFFHEVAHLLLHSKKEPFIDIDNDPKKDRMEVEADRYAANILIPKSKWNQLKKHQRYSRHLVVAFAQDIGIAPGIAVGRLQHENLIPTNQFNRLKEKYEWTPNR